jgi:hypothetical protein
MNQLRVLSLGWGVQSWTLAAMAALGEIEPIDVAVHADTTHEASGTYAHAEKWTPWLQEHGVKVVTVRPKNTKLQAGRAGTIIPAFTNIGQVRRECTKEWKISPIRRYIRTLFPDRPRPNAVQLFMGISWDEALRMKDSNVKYITHKYPLVDRRIRRTDCIQWLEQNNLDVPPKSSCVFCPYRNRTSWQELKRNGGWDWEQAVIADKEIRNLAARHGISLYLHPYRKPLAEAISIPEDLGAKKLGFGDGDPTCDSGFCFS